MAPRDLERESDGAAGSGGVDFYRSEFLRRERELPGRGQRWLEQLRREGIDRFVATGFPTPRQEEWKYTNVGPFLKRSFKTPNAGNVRPSETSLSALPLPVRGLSDERMVFVNGRFCPALSAIGPLSPGMEVRSLADALNAEAASLEPYLARLAGCERQPFVALNTAFMEDGAWVRVPDNSVIKSPIHLVFVSTGGEEATVSHPRNLIQVGENSQVAILESYWGLDRGAYFTNAVTEISAGRNAVVEHYKVEWESAGALHLETMHVQQSRQSQVTSYSVSLGGALVRNDIHDVLDGEGAECALFGLYLVDGQRLVDNHTRIEHRSPHTTSRELYKGALDGKGRAVFNGQIVVHPFASRIDAKQTNKNLLLSPEAAVNSKPQLEILNNDVKCTHGSTIGRLDEEALFYLRSRGIEREEARRLLTYAFASEIVRSMRLESVREVLDRLVLMDLHGESRTGVMS